MQIKICDWCKRDQRQVEIRGPFNIIMNGIYEKIKHPEEFALKEDKGVDLCWDCIRAVGNSNVRIKFEKEEQFKNKKVS
jgi:hypothetical protein